MMKHIGKIMSVCAILLVAVTTGCSAEEKEGQQVVISVTNNTANWIYGSVYKINARGKVLDHEPIYYTIKPKNCLKWTINKSLNRTSEFHRLIFATDKWALKQKVEKNKNSATVGTKLISQSLIKSKEIRHECYEVTATSKVQIQPTQGCFDCTTSTSNERSQSIKEIKQVTED